MKRSQFPLFRMVLVVIWVLFTLSLSAWWIIFGFMQLEQLSALQHDMAGELLRHQKMLLWEGATLFIMLVAGGGALGYFMLKERKQSVEIRNFLATFTHELKTPIASLTLQAETLSERMERSEHRELLNRLLSDIRRLTLQLENCLTLAESAGSSTDRKWLKESLRVSELLAFFKEQWHGVNLKIIGDAVVSADRRALSSIFQNLIQNAVTHGKAREVEIEISRPEPGEVMIAVKDRGKGFQGEQAKLGALFARFYSGSGSGIGLHLVQSLTREMGGRTHIDARPDGFEVTLFLKGEESGIGAAAR